MNDCSGLQEWAGTELKAPPTVSMFLLVQGGKLLDASPFPSGLEYDMLNEFKDWQICAGAVNEFGAREVIGPVAVVWANEAPIKYTMRTVYRDIDDHATISAKTLPSTVVRVELHRLFKMRALLDPLSLGLVQLFCT